MRVLLRTIYIELRTSFWFVPLVMSVVGLALSYLTVTIDNAAGADFLTRILPWTLVHVDGAQQLVSTVAGSIITVASLVFSLTFVALSLMSQQLGPRVLEEFMDDRPTQVVIGFFIAAFLYCLMVLASIRTGTDGQFAPQLSIFVVVTVAVTAFGLIIYFVHHIARMVQADSIVSRLGTELKQSLADVILVGDGQHDRDTDEAKASRDRATDANGKAVKAPASGYLQFIDFKGALELANRHDLIIRYAFRPGHFVIEGTRFAIVSGLGRDEGDTEKNVEILAAIQATTDIGARRTQSQQAEFELNALVEVALRALSAGINDAYTAINCIDNIVDGLATILKGRCRADYLKDDDGKIRVFRYPQTFEHFLDTAYHTLRQNAATNVQVLIRLLLGLNLLAQLAKKEEDVRAISEHLDALRKTIAHAGFIDADNHVLEKQAEEVSRSLNNKM